MQDPRVHTHKCLMICTIHKHTKRKLSCFCLCSSNMSSGQDLARQPVLSFTQQMEMILLTHAELTVSVVCKYTTSSSSSSGLTEIWIIQMRLFICVHMHRTLNATQHPPSMHCVLANQICARKHSVGKLFCNTNSVIVLFTSQLLRRRIK